MKDRVFLDLCDGWSLGADKNQWVLLRARKRRDQTYLNPEAFVATEKRILLRVLLEKGVQPTFDVEEAFKAMPEIFSGTRN